MARNIDLTPTKTYASHANAMKAVEAKYPGEQGALWYFVATHTDGRFFPVFVGERAIQRMVHHHFNVVA